jgi:8-oxo-dGTP diphosphatase
MKAASGLAGRATGPGGRLTIELVAHMDAGDRRTWTGDQDVRPLSELGRRQAARMAQALAVAPFDALYSSPALRCRQTLEPLAAQLGLSIVELPELRETDGFLPPADWTAHLPAAMLGPLGGAYAAGRAAAALRLIRSVIPRGRVAVCSHGDVVPALVAYFVGAYRLTLPPPHSRRGGWYTVLLDGERIGIEHHEPLPDFPA